MPGETVLLDTLDGVTLTADLAVPPSPVAAAVLLHPHPLYGGDRHNSVVDALFRALPEAGVAVIRFDFRGTGDSQGEHDGGDAERLDAVAAIEAIAPCAGDGPLLLAGYSFGALVGLNVTDPRLSGWLAVAPPLAMAPSAPLAAPDHRPKLLLVPAHDQFTPPAQARPLVETWRATELEEIASADHFLAGATTRVAARAVAFAQSLLST